MSSYPDDRYEGSGYDRSSDGSGAGPDRFALERAQAAVRAPATLLILIGALMLVLVILGFIQLPGQPARIDEQIAKIDANPNLPADQKDMWKDILTSMKQFFESPWAPVSYALSGVFALLIIVGGIKLMNLSSRGFPITASILAMLPCTSSCCCILGLPVGIWTLVVLGRPEVKQAMTASRYGGQFDQYER